MCKKECLKIYQMHFNFNNKIFIQVWGKDTLKVRRRNVKKYPYYTRMTQWNNTLMKKAACGKCKWPINFKL